MSETLPPEIVRIERASGLAWSTIAGAFEAAGGVALSHTDLARVIEPLLIDRVDNPGWWAQGATVAYEQSIGRRVAGQSSGGDFQVAASRTVIGEAGELRSRTAAEAVAAGHIAGLPLGAGARESDTPKRLYWRTSLGDGAKFELAVESKTDGKCLVTLSATKLVSDVQREAARTDLKAVLAAIR